uniref:HMG box domain-containing protein n=1 Tax=Bos indicus x Bos taurus TaxID=30522 RepID=A0A4W2ESH8_BOBOX
WRGDPCSGDSLRSRAPALGPDARARQPATLLIRAVALCGVRAALGSANLFSPVPRKDLATWGRGLCSTVKNRGHSVTRTRPRGSLRNQDSSPGEFLFPPPNGTGSLLPGSSVIQTYCRDLASLPTQHVRLTDPGDPKEQDLEEPKKRKGGWPKGKKRKPPRDLAVPRAPTTGYTIFLNEQRSQLRAQHPSLPFPEITKMLAAQWAHLPQEKKQRYVCEADEDKQRYIRELQAYQNSEAYLAFLRRRAALKVQARCGTGAPGYEFEGKGLDFSAVDADENDDLYCRTCRQFFSSLHNKREHLLGKQHLQNLTGEFEKDSAECLKHLELLEGEEGQNLNKGDSEEEAEYPDPLLLGGLIPEKGFASFDLCFLQEFIFKLLQSE